nr:hypothetical protein Iba_chr04fCG7400 [Ipomoea batatas]
MMHYKTPMKPRHIQKDPWLFYGPTLPPHNRITIGFRTIQRFDTLRQQPLVVRGQSLVTADLQPRCSRFEITTQQDRGAKVGPREISSTLPKCCTLLIITPCRTPHSEECSDRSLIDLAMAIESSKSLRVKLSRDISPQPYFEIDETHQVDASRQDINCSIHPGNHSRHRAFSAGGGGKWAKERNYSTPNPLLLFPYLGNLLVPITRTGKSNPNSLLAKRILMSSAVRCRSCSDTPLTTGTSTQELRLPPLALGIVWSAKTWPRKNSGIGPVRHSNNTSMVL